VADGLLDDMGSMLQLGMDKLIEINAVRYHSPLSGFNQSSMDIRLTPIRVRVRELQLRR